MESITARRQINGLTRVDMEEYFDDVEVESLYQWIDRIPLSRPKKNIAKDFSDGILVAEIIKYYFPRMVDIHNYTPAAATKQKMDNWYHLNGKVLRKLDLELSDDVIRALSNCKPKVIERVLMLLRVQIDKLLEKTVPFITPATPPRVKSPVLGDGSRSPLRNSKSEPASPRKLFYGKGEIPHGHPDRTLDPYLLEPYSIRRYSPPFDSYRFRERHGSYLNDKFVALPLVPKAFVPPASDNVPRVLYEEKDMECQAKEETIQILNAKIRRLEHLVHLKDVRIEDLHSTLQQTIGLGYTNRKR